MSFSTGMDARLITPLATAVLSIFLASTLLADRVYLKNGRNIDGVIVKETASALVLDIGAGKTTIASNKIAKVERTSDANNEQLTKEWKNQYFLQKKNVPQGLENIAEEFKRLQDARAEAIRMQQYLSKSKHEESNLIMELDELVKRHQEVSTKLVEAEPAKDKNLEAYNAMVFESNVLGAKRTLKSAEIDDVKKNRRNAENTVSHYIDKLTAFESLFAECSAKLRTASDQETLDFLDRLAPKLKEVDADLQPFTIQTVFIHGNRIVSVTINDKTTGTFVLDTGATSVSMSKNFAHRLNLNLSKAKPAEVTVADGRRVPVLAVLLNSVQTGDARAENVPAVIIDSPSNEDVDGLLGMSFLRNFVTQLDGTTGKLTLKQFIPK